jgi:SAM-dependent methyltransferase
MQRTYINSIIKHYEDCLDRYGDNHLGVDWPNAADADKRYRIMLDIIRVANDQSPLVTLLDFGCGTAQMLSYINERRYRNLDYQGLDISEKFINVCTSKFPHNQFFCVDILRDDVALSNYDYIIMNGVFTEKRDLSFDEMWEYCKQVVRKLYGIANKGIAFNVMSKNVQWERDDLFHLSTDVLTSFITGELSRNFVIRSDYGLYEYTVYIYKDCIN